MFKIFLNSVKVQCFAVELDLAGGHDLLVFHGEFAFTLHQRNILLTEAFALQIDLVEILTPVFCLDLRTERTVRNGGGKRHLIRGEFRQLIVEVFLLFFVKFVCCVERMADINQRVLCVEVLAFGVQCFHDVKNILCGSC